MRSRIVAHPHAPPHPPTPCSTPLKTPTAQPGAEIYGQDKFQNHLGDVKRELENFLGLHQKQKAKLKDMEVNFKSHRERITHVFNIVQQFLEKEKCRHMSNLEEKEKRILQKIREKLSELDKWQASVRDQITQMELKCQQPDVEFLKEVKSISSRFEQVKSLPPNSENIKEQEKGPSKDEEEVKKVKDEKEDWRWARCYAREVTLDPDTAHRWLALSEDGRSVKDGDRAQHLPNTPERFDPVICVLGRERLSSGRHYWEVEVGDKTAWFLGVCDESASRKEAIALSPERGYWAVWLRDGEYKALSSPSTPLTPSVPPRVVGLFLDYEAGRFSVYNVTDRSLLFTFPGAPFPRTLRPFFSPELRNGGKNATPMRVLPVTGRE